MYGEHAHVKLHARWRIECDVFSEKQNEKWEKKKTENK